MRHRMRSIIYDVAVSLDGFVAGPAGDVSAFPFDGAHVEAYQARLVGYDTVLMGRRTYEFGYAWGLKPGQRAYPHMEHHIVSSTLVLGEDSEVTVHPGPPESTARSLKNGEGGPVYLCGGGELAGALANAGLIDELCLKVIPITIGAGIRLFEGLTVPVAWENTSSVLHDNGVRTSWFAHKPA